MFGLVQNKLNGQAGFIGLLFAGLIFNDAVASAPVPDANLAMPLSDWLQLLASPAFGTSLTVGLMSVGLLLMFPRRQRLTIRGEQ